MNHKNSAIFIISHARANKQLSYKMFREKLKYTGKIYIVVDTGDTQLSEYQKLYSDDLLIFDKEDIQFDWMTNRKEYAHPVYARNFVCQYAKKIGLECFLLVDDDVSNINVRYLLRDKLGCAHMKNFNAVLDSMYDLVINPSVGILSICAQIGTIGGVNQIFLNGVYPVCACVFVIDAKKNYAFKSFGCEDELLTCETYRQGMIAVAYTMLQLVTPSIGTNEGGMHSMYENSRNFFSFPMVISFPTTCKLTEGKKHYIKCTYRKDNMFPKVLSESVKKYAE